MSKKRLHGPYIKGLGTNAVPLFLSKKVCMVRIVNDKGQMLYRYFLVTSVVCQKFAPKQCVVYRFGFFYLWSYIFVQTF